MSNPDRLPADVLRRKAVVYVRQSTQTQVQVNPSRAARTNQRFPRSWPPRRSRTAPPDDGPPPYCDKTVATLLRSTVCKLALRSL
jgi:hypothetical protein